MNIKVSAHQVDPGLRDPACFQRFILMRLGSVDFVC